ncbi:MAG: hypothetical protein OIF57_14325 [Marinobacterium sp.]|nr:hypothetical protein [Marinobacterium sp.]
MEQWKAHMRAGNVQFEAGQSAQALVHYRQGLERARQLFPVWFDRQQAVAALVVSHHNLADAHLSRQQIVAAEQQLRDCYDFLFNTAATAHQPDELDDALLQGLRRSYSQLMSHIQLYGSEQDAPLPFHLPAVSSLHNLRGNP